MYTNLTTEELVAKLQEYEAIINDQKTLIEQLIDHNKKLTEIATTYKEAIIATRINLGQSPSIN
jgi:hypothetical protein